MSWQALTKISFFFLNDTATTEIYTLSLHDALPISWLAPRAPVELAFAENFLTNFPAHVADVGPPPARLRYRVRSEEHTSELQSPCNLVCRLLLANKKT